MSEVFHSECFRKYNFNVGENFIEIAMTFVSTGSATASAPSRRTSFRKWMNETWKWIKIKYCKRRFREVLDFDALTKQYHYQDVKIEIVIHIKNNGISKDKPPFNYDLLQSFKQLYVAKGGKTQGANSYSDKYFLLKLKKEFFQNELLLKLMAQREE